MQIRDMLPGDISSCAEILCSVHNNAMRQCCWTQENAVTYLTDISRMPRFLGYVVVEEDEVLGAIFAREKIWWNNHEVYAEEMFVRPERQQNGIGSQLMRRVEDDVRRHALGGVTLSTNRYAPAAQFYRKVGFADCGHVLFMAKEMPNDEISK